jgi:hypothetical protein
VDGSPVIDIFLKQGDVEQYSSYLGLSPGVGAGSLQSIVSNWML